MIYLHGRWEELGVVNTGEPFGPEIGAAQSLNDSVTFAKVALGGAPIEMFMEGAPIFSQMLDAPLASRCVLLWVQGETDASNHELATRYETNFKTFLASMRTKTSCGNMTVVSALLRPNEFGLTPHHSIVNAALRAVSDAVVDTSNYTLSDSIHYDGASTLRLGPHGRALLASVAGALRRG